MRYAHTRLSQFAIIAIAAVVAIVAVIVVPGKRSTTSTDVHVSPGKSSASDRGRAVGKSESVAKATFKGTWPFTVAHGTLRCSRPRSILFDTTNGYEYGLNPAAQSDGYAPPDAIRASRSAPLTDMVNRGLSLCQG